MKALIDGDVIVYQGGFASDQTKYSCPDGFTCKYKKDAVTHCVDNGLVVALIEKTVTAEPVEYCLSSIKKMIKGICDSVDADDYTTFLTGKGNFREKIYTEYKANRDRTHRPTHYTAIREYLLNFHNGDEVVGVEADDAMGWHQYKDIILTKGDQLDGESCICTIDKDLNQIPGWHYNWRADDGEGSMYWIDPEEANRFFFQQWLVGDQADNIPGIKGMGDKTAIKYLGKHLGNGQPEAGIPYPTSREYYACVRKAWTDMMPQCSMKYMHMIGDLLWMQRNPGETWDMYLGLMNERKAYEQAEAQ